MRVAIVGSREFRALQKVLTYVRDTLDDGDWVVTGGALGVDQMAEDAARSYQRPYLVFPAQWKKLGRGAGFIRNALIVDNADRVVAFWDGESKGTQHTIELARKAGLPVEVIQ